MKPVLLLDVDGVVSAWSGGTNPEVLTAPDTAWEYVWPHGHAGMRVPHGVRGRLLRLAQDFEVWWCTGWEEHAAHALAPHLGDDVLDWMVVKWPDKMRARLTECTWKLETVDAVLEDRPAAWVDDNVNHEVIAWALGRTARTAPTYVVKTESHTCLQDAHVAKLLEWARGLTREEA